MDAYHLATRPYDVIAAVNRYAVATGSPRRADLSHFADYNGHAVSVYYNAYRGYWLAEYTWAGRQVLSRGSLADALRAAKAEYDRGALGSSVQAIYPKSDGPLARNVPSESPEDFETACKAAGYAEGREGPMVWRTPLHDEVCGAFAYERHGLAPATGFLCNSKTLDEYKAKLDAFFAERKARRA